MDHVINILIVDDEKDIVQALKIYLSSEQYNTFEAYTGRQALEILEAVTTEEGIRLLQEGGNLQKTMQILMEKIMFYLQKRAAGRLQIECMMYANGYGLLAESSGAEAMLETLMKNEN